MTTYDGKLWVLNGGGVVISNTNGIVDESSGFELHAQHGVGWHGHGLAALDGEFYVVDQSVNQIRIYNPNGTNPSQ